MYSILLIFTLLIISVSSITCKSGKDCIIDSNNINFNDTNTINAQNATTLILKCYDRSCKNAVIKCPNNLCNIICYNEHSCSDAQITTYTNTKLTLQSLANNSAYSIFITGDNTNEINLLCQADESCKHAVIFASNAQNINIFCATRRPHHDSCSYLKLYAENANTVNINCGNGPSEELLGGSCERAELNVDNANNVTILAHDIQYGKIKASNANNFNLTCIAKRTINDGCYHTDIWFPNRTDGINTFNCYGSCQLLDIFDIKCDVFNAMNINLNGCGLTDNIFDFIKQWSFWYNNKQNAINSSQDTLHCFPWQDDEFVQSCNCSDMSDMVSNLFINDAEMEECNIFYDQASTTLFPIFNTSMTSTSYYTTTEKATEKATDPTLTAAADIEHAKENTKMKGAVLALVIIIPFTAVLVVIGFVIFFQYNKRRSTKEYKHKKIKVIDNDDESEYDMENVPIATDVQMQGPDTTYRY